MPEVVVVPQVQASTAIRMFFDYVSPFSYIAWSMLPALAQRYGRQVEPVPVLFAALLDAHGSKGPAEIPAKRVYMCKEAVRRARIAGLPFMPPPAHPFNPLLALRVSSFPMSSDDRKRLVGGLLSAAWATGAEIDTPEAVAAIAAEVGLDGPALVAAASTPGAKERLRGQTEEALRAGAFGVPSLVVDGELFWGVDSLPFLERFLQGDDPLDPVTFERFRSLSASSVRGSQRGSAARPGSSTPPAETAERSAGRAD